MKKLTLTTLLENIFLFAGGALLAASLLFYVLADMMMNNRMLPDGGGIPAEFIRDSGTVFIFVTGAAFSLTGLIYSGLNAWKKFVSGKPAAGKSA